MGAPHFEAGRQSELAVQLNRLLEKCIKDSRCVDLESLCIVAEEKVCIYRVFQEKSARLRENVPYVKVHRYNPKHLYPKLNGYGDNGQRKVWFFAVPHTVPVKLARCPYTAHVCP
jgi:hypothetical protein